MLSFGEVTPGSTTLDAVTPYERGVQRGSADADAVRSCWQGYDRLFSANGIAPRAQREAALSCLDAVAGWAPFLADEIRGTAVGAGMELWQVAALNARTELLSMSTRARPGECSTVISAAAPSFSAQTWDWHVELAESWHLQEVETATGRFVGLTEYGILGKIGVNSAGVAVHLNVLGHQGDQPGAVPVHLAAAHVLHSAGSLDDAVDLLLDAPVRTSSAVSVVTEDGAAVVELSPEGAAVLRPDQGYLLHTNHFLDPRLARGEKRALYQPDSDQRIGLLRSRCADRFDVRDPLELVGYLCSTRDDGADLCCVPDPAAPLGERWATLATVVLRPETRTMKVSPGTPTMVTPSSWVSLGCG
jgi:isopenicillin-N N-acyltransferase-like protein